MYSTKKRKLNNKNFIVEKNYTLLIYNELKKLNSKIDKLDNKVNELNSKVEILDKKLSPQTEMQYNYYS